MSPSTSTPKFEPAFDPADADSRGPALRLLRSAVARLDAARADQADLYARSGASPAMSGGPATPASNLWESLQSAASSAVTYAEDVVIELLLVTMGRSGRFYSQEKILDEALPVSFELDGRHFVVSRPDYGDGKRLELLVVDANSSFDSGQFGRGPTEATEPGGEKGADPETEPPAPLAYDSLAVMTHKDKPGPYRTFLVDEDGVDNAVHVGIGLTVEDVLAVVIEEGVGDDETPWTVSIYESATEVARVVFAGKDGAFEVTRFAPEPALYKDERDYDRIDCMIRDAAELWAGSDWSIHQLRDHPSELLRRIADEQKALAKRHLVELVLHWRYRGDVPAEWDMCGFVCNSGPDYCVRVGRGTTDDRPLGPKDYGVEKAWVQVNNMSEGD